MTKINLAVAGALMASPFWLEQLTYASQMAALIAPFFGLVIGALTLVKMIRDWNKPKT